jgi:hypothetical protein
LLQTQAGDCLFRKNSGKSAIEAVPGTSAAPETEMSKAPVSRIKAATLHLLISAGIAAAVTSLILFVWYPYPLFGALGGQLLLPMIIGIDVCLGPLLTLIIFNPHKARHLLILDLSIIATMQVIALAYGIYAAYEGRPVFIAYAQERFVVVPANALDVAMLNSARSPEFRTTPLWGPAWVGARQPLDPREIRSLNFDTAVTGMDIHYQPKYYVALSQVRDELARSAMPLDKLRGRYAEAAARMAKAAGGGPGRSGDIGFIPLYSKRRVMTVLVDKSSGKILRMLDIDPR